MPRIGLSATLGDMRAAAAFLRPGEPDGAEMIESTTAGQEIKLLVRGYEEPLFDEEREIAAEGGTDQGIAAVSIARDMFKALKGSKNLIFANSRRRVEELTDRLARCCETESLPTEFYAHHGSLSKSLREEVEAILKEPNRPATAVCTSTLEMGIDIGQVKSVAQLDPPFSVASLRQRLGRSGRRGEAAVLRMIVTEPELHSDLAPQDALRLDLFQAVAVTNLLLSKWCEPPTHARLHLSTLVQQVLSVIAQYGGLTAMEAWKITCSDGPFRAVDSQMFAQLLRGLAAYDVLTQSADGTLLHGPLGERIVNHYSFYTAFWPSEEFKVVHGTSVLGTLPVSQPLMEKSLILFGGRRWRVVCVDEGAKVVEVVPAQGGRAPAFSGRGGHVHRRIHEEMERLYRSSEMPQFLDARAATLMKEGRTRFGKYGFDHTRLVGHDGDSLLFLWAGDLVANTLLVELQSLGYSALSFGVGLVIEGIEPAALKELLFRLLDRGPIDPVSLAEWVPNRCIDRYDCYLPLDLLALNYASAELDAEGARQVLAKVLSQPVSE